MARKPKAKVDPKTEESLLSRLLKAEHNEWAGTIGRQQLRDIADGIRAELRGEVKEGDDE